MATHAHQTLLAAIAAADRATVRRVLATEPACASQPTPEGLSPLRLALYEQQSAIAQDLLAVLPVEALSVHDAAAAGVLERLATLLAADASAANTLASDGFPPLALAAYFGQRGAVELLLRHGADVRAVARNDFGVTALHAALAGPDPDVARLLVAAGADVNARQSGNSTPLHSTAANGYLELTHLLLERGADPQARNAAGRTPAEVARQSGHAAVADALEQAAAAAS